MEQLTQTVANTRQENDVLKLRFAQKEGDCDALVQEQRALKTTLASKEVELHAKTQQINASTTRIDQLKGLAALILNGNDGVPATAT